MMSKKRPRIARGRKPTFFSDPAVDKLVAITMALAGEVSVLRDRIDTHERLAGKKERPTVANVEASVASDEEAVARQARRDEFVDRVFKSITDELDRVQKLPKAPSYNEVIDELST